MTKNLTSHSSVGKHCREKIRVDYLAEESDYIFSIVPIATNFWVTFLPYTLI